MATEVRVGRCLTARAATPSGLSRLRRLRASIASTIAALSLTACVQPDDGSLAWYDQPNDPQVYALVLDRCLNSTRGPQSTKYNDWDEAIQACGSQASNVSRYCPAGARCKGGTVTQAQVRAVLAQVTA